MSRANRPKAGSWDPGIGLRALAELINDALASMGAQPAFAAAAPTGPVAAKMAIDVSAPHRSDRRAAASGRPGSTPPDPPGDTDEIDEQHTEVWRLVSLAQAGDGEAFGQLYDRYVDTVYRFIFYRVNDRALAEDFTSETFLRALRRIGSISYQGRDIGAWFVTIARNIVLDHVKSARHRLEVTTADTFEGDDREPGPEATVIEALTNERLMAAVAQLGDEQRECVMLRFIQGFSVSETASVMGKNDGAIKALQHRAVRKLAELVGGDLR
jgi:RNA polymerase sigma-70 factor (ECF subfamily)